MRAPALFRPSKARPPVRDPSPERTAYYIDLARKVPAAAAGSSVKVTPFVDREHFGVELDNGIITARFLETGGRLISFKVNGTETFARPEWKKVLSPRERARRQPDKSLVLNMPEYGGMEDASGSNHRWTISAVDWDMEILELSERQAAVAFSSMIPGTPFLLRRVATLKKGASELQFDYNIRNITINIKLRLRPKQEKVQMMPSDKFTHIMRIER